MSSYTTYCQDQAADCAKPHHLVGHQFCATDHRGVLMPRALRFKGSSENGFAASRCTSVSCFVPQCGHRSEEQILAISAWIALKEGARVMRAAADSEDGSVKHVAMENRLYPLRELYGELLLELGQPAAAVHEFETALEQTPNRYRTFLGLARAANAAGDRQKASDYYGKVVNLAKNADTERPETQEAKAFLASKQ